MVNYRTKIVYIVVDRNTSRLCICNERLVGNLNKKMLTSFKLMHVYNIRERYD